jgi:serine/threonine-protein kinase
MAKDPDQRYPTTVELARAAHDATTVPFPRPDQLTGAPTHLEHTQLAATRAAPVLPPPGPPRWQPPPQPTPTPKRPSWRRPRVIVPALLAVMLLIAGGVFAAVNASKPHNQPTATVPPPAAVPNTGPFTGTYTANFGARTDVTGKRAEGFPPATETWGLRSACPSTGCIATASRRSGQTTNLSTLVFDNVGGRWLAVGLGSDACNNGAGEAWVVYTLQPHPDGTIAGEYSTVVGNCADKRTVTFTRTGDVDVNSLPDPASQPPRLASPADALHGHYHETRTYPAARQGSAPTEDDLAVRTDCLRTGDRCMSYFHSDNRHVVPLMFVRGKWMLDTELDLPCSASNTSHVKRTAEYPLPAPPQDPITLLTGHGHQDQSAPCVGGFDFNDKYVRTGD